MVQIRTRGLEEAYHKLVQEALERPDNICSPRGQLVKELVLPTVVVEDPRDRLISSPIRAANYGFATGEFCWYWSGRNDLHSIHYYNRRMDMFSDDGRTVNSAYGKLMHFGWDMTGAGDSQWRTAVSELTKDRDTRRAIVQIHQPWHQQIVGGTKDVPCTLSLQFFIRDNRLSLHVHMRSNDVIWGLANDGFSFTLFQECMRLELRDVGVDVELGPYYHTALSMHIYERHFGMCERMIREPALPSKPMEPIGNLNELETLLRHESQLRVRTVGEIDVGLFAGGLRWMAERLNEHRKRRDQEERRDGE